MSLFTSKDLNLKSWRRMPILICVEDSEFVRGRRRVIEEQINGLIDKLKKEPSTMNTCDLYISLFSDKVTSLSSNNGFTPLADFKEKIKLTCSSNKVRLVTCLNNAYTELLAQEKDYANMQRNEYEPVILLIGSGECTPPEDVREINPGLYTKIQNDRIAFVSLISSDNQSDISNYAYIAENKEDSIMDICDEPEKYFNRFFESIQMLSNSAAGRYNGVLGNSSKLINWKELK